MMQEKTTIRKPGELRLRNIGMGGALLAVATLMGCDEPSAPSQASTSGGTDSAAAYLALSATLEACEDQLAACEQAAGADAAAQATCEGDFNTCTANTQEMEAAAEQTLEHEAHHCRKVCSEEDAGPGGFDDGDAGSGDMHECMSRHAPKLPACFSDMIACLDDAGLRERQASRRDIRACLHEAHHCFKQELATRRAERRERRKSHHASAAQPGDAGTEVTNDTDDTDNADNTGDDARRGRRWRPFWKR